MSNSVVRTRLIFALFLALLACLAVSAQQKEGARDNIVWPVHPPHLIKKVEPIYPPLANQTHVSGKVTLRCVIARDGSVKAVLVVKGHPLLVQAAIDAVSQWKYKPLLLNGEAIEVGTTVEINFVLPNKQKKEDPAR